ncbi:hypothetical protein KR51_00011330 [Rubidibacter lacunae KORDI 51-2]|uniref:Uncharacterized protein n=1 Tax=Rubidibacter lacunae KORDI 51-2 TaxID=582515 RepID=U5DNM2_9CHRO|nr:hypothetical protein [Rubidibacter lacunae]ERN42204.1 hypothetical protein KR51_00011330 [Rubidibacter lacunae KORDI 51-2]
MFTYLYAIFEALKPLWSLLGMAFAWGFALLLGWSLLSAIRDAIARSRTMHRIPCTNCLYFTHSSVLKCTVKPAIATTEAAIACSDYSPQSGTYGGTR